MAKGKYTEWLEPDNLLRLEAWTRDGALDKEIADAIGVNPATICEWKNRFPEFAKALKRSRDIADITVENSLFRSANGFKETIKKGMKCKTTHYKDGKKVLEKEDIVYYDEEVFINPAPSCQFFWLKNRKPDVWRDKRVIETTEQIDKLDETLKAIKESGSFTPPPKDEEVD